MTDFRPSPLLLVVLAVFAAAILVSVVPLETRFSHLLPPRAGGLLWIVARVHRLHYLSLTLLLSTSIQAYLLRPWMAVPALPKVSVLRFLVQVLAHSVIVFAALTCPHYPDFYEDSGFFVVLGGLYLLWNAKNQKLRARGRNSLPSMLGVAPSLDVGDFFSACLYPDLLAEVVILTGLAMLSGVYSALVAPLSLLAFDYLVTVKALAEKRTKRFSLIFIIEAKRLPTILPFHF